MSRDVGPKFRTVEGGALMFWCPGCDGAHAIHVEGEGTNPHTGAKWKFNGDYDKPTFSPSIKVSGTLPLSDEAHAAWMAKSAPLPKPVKFVCHSFVRDGQIEFLSDCAHALAGQTVPLPDFDD